ncbi:MAG: MATE family efflux transporter [Chloroflexi bacterium]|nr:MATE family efflux transporter [Chloroflexota bacterium]
MRMARGHAGRGARFDRDWTKGSIIGNLWDLAWPIMVTQTLTTLGPTMDMIWVGKLGAAAIAGVGISGMVVQLMSAARMGLQTGERALIARFVGAGDEQGAAHVAQQALVTTVAFAMIVAVIGIFLSRQILMLLGLEADVVTEGAAYMRIQLAGMVTMSFQMMTQSIMQASGDTKTPMWISIGARLFHIALSPFLIFGWWFFPRLGVSGAALTNVISQGTAGGLGIWMLCSGRSRLWLTMRHFRFDWNVIWRIVRISIPATLNGTERNVGNLLVTWFVVPFGTLAVAAHSLLDRLDRFIHMPAQGLGQGAGVLAGQNLGAGQPQRADRTAWLSVNLFTGMMVIVSIALWFWAEPLIRLFNTEPGLVEIASTFLRIQIISYLVFGYAQVLQQCLNGVGDTLMPLLITLVTMWLVQMPLAYFLPRVAGLGVLGVRWGMVVAIVVRAALYAAYFKTGRWQRKRI